MQQNHYTFAQPHHVLQSHPGQEAPVPVLQRKFSKRSRQDLYQAYMEGPSSSSFHGFDSAMPQGASSSPHGGPEDEDEGDHPGHKRHRRGEMEQDMALDTAMEL
ncbi:hypothetical protein MVEG_06838 [Podila verticillata NRRL 6337]|nr:hypothetical protein MVEG_06838 [Podila verticillata NRRL 6337]